MSYARTSRLNQVQRGKEHIVCARIAIKQTMIAHNINRAPRTSGRERKVNNMQAIFSRGPNAAESAFIFNALLLRLVKQTEQMAAQTPRSSSSLPPSALWLERNSSVRAFFDDCSHDSRPPSRRSTSRYRLECVDRSHRSKMSDRKRMRNAGEELRDEKTRIRAVGTDNDERKG